MPEKALSKIVGKLKNKYVEAVFRHLFAFFAGFTLAYSGRNSFISPLGVCAVCASGEKTRVSVSLGVSLGYIMYSDSFAMLRFAAAVICAFVLSKLFSSFDFSSNSLSLSLAAAFCLFSSAYAVSASRGLGKTLIGLHFSEALVGFVMTYILKSTCDLLESKAFRTGIGIKEFTLFSLGAGILLWSVNQQQSDVFSIPYFLILFLTLVLSCIGNGLAAVIFGSAVSVSFALLSEGTAVPAVFCISGFACCVAAVTGQKTYLRPVFLLIAVSLLYTLDIPMQPKVVYETFFACVMFELTPKKLLKKAEKLLSRSDEPILNADEKYGLSSRLRLASSAVREISSAINAVRTGLEKSLPDVRSDVFSKVKSSLCDSCAKCEKCWGEQRQTTIAYFDSLLGMLKKDEFIEFHLISADIKNSCIKAVKLTSAFNRYFLNYTVESVCKSENDEMRRTVSEQFDAVRDIIEDIAADFENCGEVDSFLSEKIRLIAFSSGIRARRCACRKEKNGCIKIEIECAEISDEFNRTCFKEKIEKLCSRKFENPVITAGENTGIITVCQKYRLCAEVGSSQITSQGEKLCGDSFEYFYDGRGNFNIVLADGMGTGARAALDSSVTRGLAGTLLKRGMTPSGSIRLVNSALMVKSAEESLSTLDIMQVDMFSGKTRFFKAGAAPSFIRRRGRVTELKKSALPLGILHDVEFGSLEGAVSAGDIAVMVSDGITDAGTEYVKEALKKYPSLPSGKLADVITEAAKRQSGGKHDDLTAVVCKFH